MRGSISKMKVALPENGGPVQYTLRLGDESVLMNDFLGKEIALNFTGNIFCSSCGKKTKKSFGGFCYNCFTDSPENAECIIRPELCQGHEGIGRDPQWELDHHVQPHYVYLSLSSDIKVGVTRSTQVPTRWIDQGASAGLIIAEVPYRQLAGKIEVALKSHFTDKTNWQRMLKNEHNSSIEALYEKRAHAISVLPEELEGFGQLSSQHLDIVYPVLAYPPKVSSTNFDKEPNLKGVLKGIKAQYLIFEDNRVINLRSMTGYEVEFG